MGHYCIVDKQTLAETVGKGAVRVKAKLGADPKEGKPSKVDGRRNGFVSQLADIFADALVVRPGDLVVPWQIKVAQGVAFHTVCRAHARAHFAAGAEYPLVIPLATNHVRYPGLTEAEALDLWETRLLWNAIGKKSLGRGRGVTHQTPLEDEELLLRLAATGAATSTAVPPLSLNGMVPLTIRTTNGGAQTLDDLASLPAADRLSAVKPGELSWVDGREFRVEKALEAWLAENHDGPKGESFRASLLEAGERVLWIGNYLPFGVAGASIDLVAQTETVNGLTRYHVIELKKETLAPKAYGATSVQVLAYRRMFLKMLMTWTSAATAPEVKTCIVSAMKVKGNSQYSPDVTHVVYRIEPDGTVTFARVQK